jgi:hypothetical protein
MSVSDITSREAVLEGIRQCDEMGRDNFLRHYGFGRARSYFLVYKERDYDSKAILGVAHGIQFPAKGPLKSREFEGGYATVKKKLESLGFKLEVRQNSEARSKKPESGQ